MKVITFKGGTPEWLDEKINNWLKGTKINIISHKFSTTENFSITQIIYDEIPMSETERLEQLNS